MLPHTQFASHLPSFHSPGEYHRFRNTAPSGTYAADAEGDKLNFAVSVSGGVSENKYRGTRVID